MNVRAIVAGTVAAAALVVASTTVPGRDVQPPVRTPQTDAERHDEAVFQSEQRGRFERSVTHTSR